MIEMLQEADCRDFVIDVGNMSNIEAIQYIQRAMKEKHLDYKI